MREQVEILEHHAHAPALGGDASFAHRSEVAAVPLVSQQVTVEIDGAAVDLLELVDAADEGGLAGPGRTDDDHDLALVDVEADLVEGDVGPEHLPHLMDLQDHGAAFTSLPVVEASGTGGSVMTVSITFLPGRPASARRGGVVFRGSCGCVRGRSAVPSGTVQGSAG